MLILKENAANSVPVPPSGKDTFFIDDSGTPSVKNAAGNVSTFPTTAASNSQVLFMNGTALTGDADITWNFNTNVLTIVGNVAAGNVKTDNLLYANGTAWDLSDPGGSNTQIQFNDDESFGGSAAFTFNKSSNLVSMGGALSVTGNANVGNIGAAAGIFTTVAGSLTTASQPNITSVGTLTSLTVTGNVSAGNVSGTLLTGTLATAAQPNVTSVGTLTGLGVNGTITGVNITANTGVFTGNGSGLSAIAGANVTGIVANATHASTANTVVDAAQPNITSVGSLTSLTVTGNASAGNISTGGVLSVTGNANVGNLGTAGLITATGNVSGGNLTTGGAVVATGNVTGGNLTTAGALSVTGNANVGNIGAAAGVFTTVAGTLTTAAQPNVTSVGTLTSLTVTGNISAGNVSATTFTGALSGAATTAGTVTTAAQPNITSVGTLSSLAVTGNATAGNVYANSGTIGASLLTGTLTTAAQPNVTSVGTLTSLGVNGTVTAVAFTANTGVFTGNGSGLSAIAGGNVTGQVANATVAGTVYTAAQPNITSVGTLSSLAVTGNVAAGNLTTTGVLSVTGTGVSSIAGNLDMTSNTIINLATPSNPNDAATKQYVDDVAQGLNIHDSCQAATPDTLANVTSGTITYNNGTAGVGANLVTTGSFNLIDGVNVQTSGTRILVKNEANTVHNGIYTWANSTTIVRATDYNNVPEVEAGDFTFVTGGTLYDNTGWVQTSSPATIGGASDFIEFTQFSGAGTYQAGTGLTLTGPTFSVNASQSQITSVGTLSFLGVDGNLTAANVFANTGAFYGNGSGLSDLAGGNVTGQVANALVAGTVYTAAQPNITSVGTLSSLGVSGTITASNVTANTGIFTGNGSGLSAIAGANVTGTVSSATTAGTVTTAAQPNITSTGTLTSLAVTGNISAGNVSATTFTGALSGAATTAGTVTTAAQPNITSVGTLTGLGVNGTVTAVNITANTGVFTGNGSALTALNGSNISTGTIAQARLANSSLTVNGTSISLGGSGTITATATNTLTLGSYLTGTSYNGSSAVTAAVDATTTNTASKVVARDGSGNFAAGTITATLSGAATTAGTVTTAAQPNITSVGTLTSLTVSGGITNANITTGANSTAGSLTGNWTLTAGSRLQATYADLAEKYVADADYEVGTVLVFGGEHEVTVAHEFDSHRVAGVVSHNAAYIMNAACEGEHVIDLALTGRVPVKVHGPVAKGDLMVTGSNGHAVANNQARAGTILGKALQNFAGESGIIEVVVGRV